MPYYKEINLLFIHIPKTGGSNIENNIKLQYKQSLFSGRFNNLLPFPYNKISLQHQFYLTLFRYRQLLKINFSNIKILTVVRNPYDRIISDLFWFKLIKPNDSSEKVLHVLKTIYFNPKNNFDNHRQPQYKFICDKDNKLIPGIKIFKTETLNIKNNELNQFLGFSINIKKHNSNKNYSKFLNKRSISLINSVYKKDFELFNYKFR